MKIISLPLLLGLCFFCGCASESIIKDVPAKNNLYYKETRAWADNDKLFIVIDQIRGFNLMRITPILYNNEIYLDQLRISSGGCARTLFEIDLNSFELSDDWPDHVYWIAGGSYGNLWAMLSHSGPLPHCVERIKVDVLKSPMKCYDSKRWHFSREYGAGKIYFLGSRKR